MLTGRMTALPLTDAERARMLDPQANMRTALHVRRTELVLSIGDVVVALHVHADIDALDYLLNG